MPLWLPVVPNGVMLLASPGVHNRNWKSVKKITVGIFMSSVRCTLSSFRSLTVEVFSAVQESHAKLFGSDALKYWTVVSPRDWKSGENVGSKIAHNLNFNFLVLGWPSGQHLVN